MSLLELCPRCGCTCAKGARCPQCRYTDNLDAGCRDDQHAAEYARRCETHRRHYLIWMSLVFALSTVSILLAGTVCLAVPQMSFDELNIVVSPPASLMFVAAVLLAAESALTYAVWKSRERWPVDLRCPGCNLRLDELGANPEHCPSCQTRLR